MKNIPAIICAAAMCLIQSAALSAADEIPVPPAEHPRLYIRSGEIPALRERMASPEGKDILKKMRKCSIPRTDEEEAAETDRGFRYYFKMRGKPMEAQLLALDYLTTGNDYSAKRAINSMLDTLLRTNFGTKQDLSRASGVMLMTGAIVYDWCYDRMDDATRQAYIREFVRIAGTMECGYPPKNTEPIAGHSSEWMVLRDMLSAGIAIYDEYPDMYNHVVKMLLEDYVAPRNYIYSGRNYHQGTSYVNVRFSNDLIAQWIMTKMGAGPLFSADQQYVLYDAIYRRRPDGQLLPAGDCNPNRRGFIHTHTLPAMLASSYYHDPYLAYEYERKTQMEPHCLILELLWRDFSLKGKAPDDLPLQNYSGAPFGWIVARTGWDDNCVIAEMKVNEQFVGNHQHLDGGSFQIYHKGPLAIDSGTYQGSSGGYNSPHCKNYFKRTIAHNSLLVYDPDEKFACWNYGGGDKTEYAANDGGQRMPGDRWETCRSFKNLLSDDYTVGKELSHYADADWTCLKGDITKAYSEKVSDVRRSFVFMDMHSASVPAVLVVFDHVVAAKADFRKYFLLHSIEEPQISGNTYTIGRTLNNDSGMLHCTALYPEYSTVEKVGGPGKEFWVFGENYPNNRKDDANERGAWRIEVCPANPALEDIFLNVIQIGDTSCRKYQAVLPVESEKMVGACLDSRAALFSRDGKLVEDSVEFTLPKGKERSIIVTDLAAGQWNATLPCGRKITLEAKDSENLVILSGKAGRYILRRL